LTTVRQPLRAMGSYAVERLRFRIEEEDRLSALDEENAAAGEANGRPPHANVAKPHVEIFPIELVKRGSTSQRLLTR
jgi:hypothetical protein